MNLGSGPVEGDTFGHALLARQEGRVGDIVSERDDGLVELDSFDYFSAPHGPLWDWVVARVGHASPISERGPDARPWRRLGRVRLATAPQGSEDSKRIRRSSRGDPDPAV